MKHLFILIALTSAISVQTYAQQKPTKVLLLGCFHFDNPGLDVAKFESADIMNATRQKEVEEVVQKLLAYKPDKIFVEVPAHMQERLDASLEKYKNGETQLNKSETQQLGYRLARQLGHAKLYAVDHRDTEFPMDSLVKVLMANQQFDMLQTIQRSIDSIQNDFNAKLKTMSIRQLLIDGNEPSVSDLQVGGYFQFLKSGDLNNHVGSYLTSEWWRRNMIIYGNIQKQLSGNEDRILVIFGLGHTALLDVMMRYNKGLEIVPVSKVL
ncbi:MAG TPA: DUF5694 domain-containing protein [Phnomibacter sp.]|nr:DUF5694 domain-containing protein [Phnomibacter sp.]